MLEGLRALANTLDKILMGSNVTRQGGSKDLTGLADDSMDIGEENENCSRKDIMDKQIKCSVSLSNNLLLGTVKTHSMDIFHQTGHSPTQAVHGCNAWRGLDR